MTTFKTVIRIKKTSDTPIFLQITNAIIREIQKGIFMPGIKLPGTRYIAEHLQIHRKTVVAAFEELSAQGWLTTIPSKGTFISNKLPIQHKNVTSVGERKIPEQPGFLFRPNLSLSKPLMINHKILTINDGFPDTRLAPALAIGKAYKNVISRSVSKTMLSYTEVEGNEFLRITLAKYLNESRGLNISKENILITRGSQMGIYLVAKTLFSLGDNVIVGEPNYFVANMAFVNLGAKLMAIPIDEDGLCVDQIENICRKKTIKAVFVTPHHHHPTTVTLSAERRLNLLQLAQKFHFAIIEDDYDYDFHYSSSPLLPLTSIDRGGYTIYVGSFSKTIAPAIRIGYIVGSKNLITEISKVRRIIDRQGDPVLERALAELIKTGEIKRNLNKALKVYQQRRDDFCKLLQENLGNYSEFKIPDGGMAVWTTFDPKISFDELIKQTTAKGLHINHASVYNPPRKNLNSTRLGFASLTTKEMEIALDILTKVIRRL